MIRLKIGKVILWHIYTPGRIKCCTSMKKYKVYKVCVHLSTTGGRTTTLFQNTPLIVQNVTGVRSNSETLNWVYSEVTQTTSIPISLVFSGNLFFPLSIVISSETRCLNTDTRLFRPRLLIFFKFSSLCLRFWCRKDPVVSTHHTQSQGGNKENSRWWHLDEGHLRGPDMHAIMCANQLWVPINRSPRGVAKRKQLLDEHPDFSGEEGWVGGGGRVKFAG